LQGQGYDSNMQLPICMTRDRSASLPPGFGLIHNCCDVLRLVTMRCANNQSIGVLQQDEAEEREKRVVQGLPQHLSSDGNAKDLVA